MLEVVLAISVTVLEKFAVKADCHFVMDPVWPDNINTVLLVPAQTAAEPVIDPPTLD
jgi:hypothetical protein